MSEEETSEARPAGGPQLFSYDAVSDHRCDGALGSAITHTIAKLSDMEHDAFFEICETVEWILTGGYKRVALQFPDHLLRYAASIGERLERESGAKTFILADTSYRSCCIDFVAGEHARADSLVHYGDSCLTQNSQLYPVRYVFGSVPVDTTNLASALKQYVGRITESSILLYDTVHASSAKEILEVVCENVACPVFHCEVVDPAQYSNETSDKGTVSLGRRLLQHFDRLSEVTVIFVGDSNSAFLPLWLMTHLNCTKVFIYSPIDAKSSFTDSTACRQLRKRLFLIEKIRDANTLGVVVGTTGVNAMRDAVERMRQLCQRAAKKLYVLSVGKVNVAKLSNFASDIDAFVLLSCPFGVMLDQSDYYRPVVSLFEAEVALNPSKQWAAAQGWTAQFGDFVADSIGEQQYGPADMSLITGKVRPEVQRVDSDKKKGETQMALYTAGDYFANRSWKGLDDSCTEQESVQVTEGRSGIASNYVSEPSKK